MLRLNSLNTIHTGSIQRDSLFSSRAAENRSLTYRLQFLDFLRKDDVVIANPSLQSLKWIFVRMFTNNLIDQVTLSPLYT